MKRAFITGFPVKHSKSPLLHGFWLRKHNVEGVYEAMEVAPENFKDFLKELPDSGFVGGNITLPHKEIAFEGVTKRDAAAEIIGAINTLWLEDGALCGGNTDGYGFAANMDFYVPEWRSGKTAVVLGAGGASRAVIHAILEAGFTKVHIVNRTVSRAQSLADRFGNKCVASGWAALPELLTDCDFLTNTTSLGMAGHEQSNETPMPNLAALKDTSIVTDIVYTPLETPFLKSAAEYGLKTVDGLGMLLYQAVPGFEKWFGIRPKVTSELRKHILEAMK